MKQLFFIPFFLILTVVGLTQTNGFINYNGVNFRRGPGLDQERIGILYLGTKLKLIKKTDKGFKFEDGRYYKWYHVEDTSRNTKGYVYGKYISSDGPFSVKKSSIPIVKKKITSRPEESSVLKIKNLYHKKSSPDWNVNQIKVLALSTKSESIDQHDRVAQSFAEHFGNDGICLKSAVSSVQEVKSSLKKLQDVISDKTLYLLVVNGDLNSGIFELGGQQFELEQWINFVRAEIDFGYKGFIFNFQSSKGDFKSSLELLENEFAFISDISFSSEKQKEYPDKGIFGHYLHLGLLGLADNNADKKVSLQELVSYIEKKYGMLNENKKSVLNSPEYFGDKHDIILMH